MANYKLYGRTNSGSWAVQVALEEIGLPYESFWVGREPADIEQLQKINPTGKVPALVLPDGTMMFESAAMLIHLAQVYPQAGLAPAVPGQAVFLQWMVFLSANVYEAALRMYYPERYSAGGVSVDAIKLKAKLDFVAHLEVISSSLAPYVLGDRYSIADAYLYMLASWWPDDKLQFSARLPKIAAHTQVIAARPAVKKIQALHAV